MAFTQREARRLIRKATSRVPEGENITHLNIMPMMDMMTILLVAFIYQASVSTTSMVTNTVSLPKTLSADDLPENASTLIITKEGIVLSAGTEAVPVVTITNGNVDPAAKEGGSTGLKIPRLTTLLGNVRKEQVSASKKKNPAYDPAKDPPQLLIVADRTTPYHVLLEVMYSAKQKEAGYSRFRLIVEKNNPQTKPSGG